MRIVRAPLRITLGGGGTDLPGYYEKYGGYLISAAVNKFIYLTGSFRPFDKKYWLSYSKLEVCDKTQQIHHELFKKSLEKYRFKTGVEIHSISEVPGNSGLGSSGTFTVGVLTLLNSLAKIEVPRKDVAELACRIEMVELGKACGKQDQYIAAMGGIVALDIDTSGHVEVEPLKMDEETVKRLQNSLLIYHTGISRDANVILKHQNQALKKGEKKSVENMKRIKDIGYESRQVLEKGDFDSFGILMDEHWRVKKEMHPEMSNTFVDKIYLRAKKAGSLGGKLMGAGGGGFFMFYVPFSKQIKFRAEMRKLNLQELDWQFNHSGCEVIFAN